LKLWEKIKLGWKEYRLTWYAEYEWRWIEWKYSWRMWYLEWILLWNDNSYKYFSEWYSVDDWKKTYEFEFSEKYLPKWNISKVNYKEKNILTIKSVYWENSKSYTIWEKIEILDFWDYVLEKEWAWSQIEAWFYRWEKVTKRKAANIFWKWDSYFLHNANKNNNSSFSHNANKNNYYSVIIKILWFGLVWFISSFIIFKPLFWLFNNKEEIKINEISNWSKYEIIYWNQEKKVVKTKKYDYGWVRTYYESETWIKFSIKDWKDKEVLNKIITEGKIKGWEIEKISLWKAYKIN